MFFKDRLLGLLKVAVLLHEVAAGKLPLIVTSCVIISCVKPHYFRSAFLHSGFHSCPHTPSISIGMRLLCSKIYPLCYARMLKTMSNYALIVSLLCSVNQLVKTAPPRCSGVFMMIFVTTKEDSDKKHPL